MKVFATLLAITMVFGTIGMSIKNGKPNFNAKHYFLKQVVYAPPRGFGVGLDGCKTCVDVMGQVINELLNIILLESTTVAATTAAAAAAMERQASQSYNSTFSLKAQPDPNCDPTEGPCERWLPGQYNVKVAICNGECGSKHPHSQIYDQATTSFNITESIH